MSMRISHGTHLQSDRHACIILHTGQQTPPWHGRLVPIKGNPGKGAEPLLPAEEDLFQVGHCAKQHHTITEFPSHKKPWTRSDVVSAPTALAPGAAAVGMRRAYVGLKNDPSRWCWYVAHLWQCSDVELVPWCLQVPPQLSGADELLDIPLDEDCLQRLLSGDVADDMHAKVKVRCQSNLTCNGWIACLLRFVESLCFRPCS